MVIGTGTYASCYKCGGMVAIGCVRQMEYLCYLCEYNEPGAVARRMIAAWKLKQQAREAPT